MFSTEDQARIADAVKEAEQTTSGEIVPFVVNRSDDYEEAEWRGGFFLGAATLLVYETGYLFSGSWRGIAAGEISFIALITALSGLLAVKYSGFLKRLLAGRSTMDRRVAQRAAEAFVSEEVFHTQDRSGILLFISLLERKVLVVGDSGINKKVDQHAWDTIVRITIDGIREGRATEGIIKAVHECGSLLQRHGVTIRKNDVDELPNNLRQG